MALVPYLSLLVLDIWKVIIFVILGVRKGEPIGVIQVIIGVLVGSWIRVAFVVRVLIVQLVRCLEASFTRQFRPNILFLLPTLFLSFLTVVLLGLGAVYNQRWRLCQTTQESCTASM